ncbi:Fur family transcriptional regulator [Marinobacter salicampi]|uniref:Fur family transcriptional regulator n=1 Tax=Marinobacter salicampi TaxID=435907 RepID=UPI00140814D5|nr:Fur family transcriptional regulator [Marinobacter salicampi]
MSVSALPYRPHNHSACVSEALSDARRICRARNVRLTPTRERVLELVWQSHKPLGAYDLLALLTTEGYSAAPPTVYRALDFLQQNGLVHRIASLNAFIGCTHTGSRHSSLFLICRSCRNVLELTVPQVAEALGSVSEAEGFTAEETTVEIAGLCPACKSGPNDE